MVRRALSLPAIRIIGQAARLVSDWAANWSARWTSPGGFSPDGPFVVDKEGNLTDRRVPSIPVASTIEIKPGGRCLIPTGLFIALPKGYEAKVRPRSGLALKLGLTVLNSPGTIDADYRGEIGVVLVNTSNVPVRITDGERIAQIVIAKHETIEWEVVEELPSTERGEGGFGHTGV